MTLSGQGVNQDRYMLIPRTLIFLTRGNMVLLIKGGPHKRLWANLYNGIGGHVEPGEDILTAAYREVTEETGLIPEDLWLCAVITIDTKQNPGIVIFVFRSECTRGKARSSQEGTLEWIDLAQVADKPVVEDLPALLDKVMMIQAS
jgi:8-oxo-dGTP diphosphatase